MQSRDDQNEYERRQRQALRVQQQQMQQLSAQQEAMASRNMNYRRSPSPVRIQPFSNAAVVQLAEKIKSEEHFPTTLPVNIFIVVFEVSKHLHTLLYAHRKILKQKLHA